MESQGYMYNVKTKSITFLNRVPLSISYMKVKYIVHVCSCQGRSVVTIVHYQFKQGLSQLTTPVVSHTGIASTRFVTSGHMSLPPRPYLFLLSLHDRLAALSSTEFLFCYDKVLNIQCRPGQARKRRQKQVNILHLSGHLWF